MTEILFSRSEFTRASWRLRHL